MTSLAVICMEAIQGEEARADIEVMIGFISKTRTYDCDSDEADQERAGDGDHQPGPGGQPGGQLLRGDRGGREEQDHHLNKVSQTF